MTVEELKQHLEYCAGDVRLRVVFNGTAFEINDVQHSTSKNILYLIPGAINDNRHRL